MRKHLTRSSLKKVIVALIAGAVAYHGTNLGLNLYDSYEVSQRRNQVESSLVKVMGERAYGSGVIIKSDEHGSLILTNKHVCQINKLTEDDERDSLSLATYKPFTIKKIETDKDDDITMAGQVVKVAENADLCLIQTSTPNLPSAKISETALQWGDSVHGYSNPRGFEGVSSSGKVYDSGFIFNMEYQQTTVVAQPGSSGSGVFNDDGELVGLISLGDGTYAYMVPLSHIRAFTAGL